MIKSFFGEEAQSIVLKFCLGVVCVSILIFSLFQLGYAFQIWVAQYRDSFQMSASLFSTTMLLSLLGLWALFYKRKPKVEIELLDRTYPLMGMSLQEKGFVFIRGMIDGLVNGRRSESSLR